ncbi:MAG: class I SAM-dependent methyltransferase [Chloroflexi bacterium]|nr:class I SAM-dependent methyltransferase [Chloroflexota bacterium]
MNTNSPEAPSPRTRQNPLKGRQKRAAPSQPGGSRLNRMYGEFAPLWTLISKPEDYANEARCWRDILRQKLGPGKHPILELGVGGGNNLSHFAIEFQTTAVDISAPMLANSMRLNPGVEHLIGDMRTIRLGRTFKAVLVHDAINYMLTETDLRAAIATARAHLEPGGVFIAAPDWFKETFPGTHVGHHVRHGTSPEFTLIEYVADPDPDDTTMEWVYFYVFREGDPREGSSFGASLKKDRTSLKAKSHSHRVRVEEDHHIVGIFPRKTWADLLSEAGFSMETVPYVDKDTSQTVSLVVGVLSEALPVNNLAFLL